MKILLAEDEAITRRIVQEALHGAGHDVTAVGDGHAAISAFAADPAPLVVLDWQMPNASGLEVCRHIRGTKAGEHVFVLMLTGRDAAEDVAAAIDAGVDDYLIKPVAPAHLGARVQIAERRIQADAARREAERALEEARWQAHVGETVLTLQHEINNPLAALLTTLELAVDEHSTQQEQLEALPQALQQTRRIVEVMRRMANLRQRRTVEYLPGVKMLDVSRPE